MTRTRQRTVIVAILAIALAGFTATGPAPSASGQEATEAEPATTPANGWVDSEGRQYDFPAGSAEAAAAAQFSPSYRGRGGGAESGAEATAPAVEAGTDEPGDHGGESVVGVDNRRRVNNTRVYPNRAIAHLIYNQSPGGSPGTFVCSAFLIDRNTLLTSGHCVHEGGTGSQGDFSRMMQIRLGRGHRGSAARSPWGVCRARRFFTTNSWYFNGSESGDWGIIQMNRCTVRNVGLRTGWLGYFSVRGRRGLQNMPAIVQGYPGTTPPGGGPNGTQWRHKDRIRVSERSMVFYQADTSGGQSGSPVYVGNRRRCGTCAMAIHSYGFPHGSGPHWTNNHGPRITSNVFNTIRSVARMNG